MTSYLRSWLTTGISAPETNKSSTDPDPDPSLPTISPPSDDKDGSDTETELHDDPPPAFPSLLSAQRMQSTSTFLTDAQRMPPPPLPQTSRRNLGTSSLAVPPTTSKRPPKKREKVALAPGHSPLDWANLKVSGRDLRVCASVIFSQQTIHDY
jgi:hypothetical protein